MSKGSVSLPPWAPRSAAARSKCSCVMSGIYGSLYLVLDVMIVPLIQQPYLAFVIAIRAICPQLFVVNDYAEVDGSGRAS